MDVNADLQEAFIFYQSIVSNPVQLANGYQIIKDFLLGGPAMRQSTLLHLLNPTLPILTLVFNVYPNEVLTHSSVPHEEVAYTRKYILDLLISQLLSGSSLESKVAQELLAFLQKMHNNEGYAEWISLYEAALSRLIEAKSALTSKFLIYVLRSADDRVSMLAKNILRLIMTSQITDTVEDQLQLIYYCLKPMAYLYGTNDEQLRELFELTPCILEFVNTNMRVSPTSMRFSLKILTVFFADYEVECAADTIQHIQQTARLLIKEYLKYLNSPASGDEEWQEDLADQHSEHTSLEGVLYQMQQLLQTANDADEADLDVALLVWLGIVGTYLPVGGYDNSLKWTDNYLMQIEDEGDKTLRNKSISFLGQLMENEKTGKQSTKLLQKYVEDVNSCNQHPARMVSQLLAAQNIEPIALLNGSVYLESAYFILYSYTDELITNAEMYGGSLAGVVQKSSPNQLEPILAIALLNKLSAKMNATTQEEYFSFLRDTVSRYAGSVGMVLVCVRGMCRKEKLQVSSQGQGVPEVAVATLVEYVLRDDSAQSEAAHLVVDFLVKLASVEKNIGVLRKHLTHQRQIKLLETYYQNGMVGSSVSDLLAVIALPQTIEVVWGQIRKGHIKDASLGCLAGKWLKYKKFVCDEPTLVELLDTYQNKLELISEIVRECLVCSHLRDPRLIQSLNDKLQASWVLPLFKQNLLKDIEKRLVSTIRNISESLTSQSEIEHSLLLPYCLLLNNTQSVLGMLEQHGLSLSFFTKLVKYARLFQGIHLKIVTSRVMLRVAAIQHMYKSFTFQLIESYGALIAEEWEDVEEEFSLDKVLNYGLVNEEVELQFRQAFGEIAWDEAEVQRQLAVLKSD